MKIEDILTAHGLTKTLSYKEPEAPILPETEEPEHPVYGVKLDTTNPNPSESLSYIDDAIGLNIAYMDFYKNEFNYGSWENRFPFNQIKPCVLKNGVVVNYINPNDYTKTINGETITETDGDIMIEFPKIYWNFETVGTELFIRYSNHKVNDNFVCYAHETEETSLDKIYISAYEGYTDELGLHSVSQKEVTTDLKFPHFRGMANLKGAGYECATFYEYTMLQILYIVMFKNLNSQKALGGGHLKGPGFGEVYHATGQMNNKGLFYGSMHTIEGMKFCGIENWYGNTATYLEGALIDRNRFVQTKKSNFNDLHENYTIYEDAYANVTGKKTGYITSVLGTNEFGFMMKDSNFGTNNIYFCDNGYCLSDSIPTFGCSSTMDDIGGAFALRFFTSEKYANTGYNGRLSYRK